MFSVGVRVAAVALVGCFVAHTAASRMSDHPDESSLVTTSEDKEAAAANLSASRFEVFLDRLMHAESNGRDHAANPHSSAIGPFQFIKSTFLAVMRQHFPEVVDGLNEDSILALRTDRETARRAAAAYCRDNFVYLLAQGLRPTFGGLRLAFLVGPVAAAQLLKALPDTPVSVVLTAAAIKANPFMVGMRASELIARASRDVAINGEGVRPLPVAQPEPRVRSAVSPPVRQFGRPGRHVAVRARCTQKASGCRRLAFRSQPTRRSSSKAERRPQA